jgi:hypothetical protein
MERAFIVKLNIDPSEDPRQIAEEIADAVAYDFGEDLLSVEPWDAPSEALTLTPLPM